MARIGRAAILAAVIAVATTAPAQAAPRFGQVFFFIDAVSLMAIFTERELPANTDTRVEVTTRSTAVYQCIRRNGEPTMATADRKNVQTVVRGTSNSNGVYNDVAYVDPDIVYPDCPNRQYAHLVRVCYREIVLTDPVSGAVYENPNLASVCRSFD